MGAVACLQARTEPCSQGAGLRFSGALRWAPDASCILTSGSGGYIRVLEQRDSTLYPSLSFSAGEAVRDAAWFPGATSADPASAAFLVAAKHVPVHLCDGFTGATRSVYVPLDLAFEVADPRAVDFESDGSGVVAGTTSGSVYWFDTWRGDEPAVVLDRPLGKSAISCIDGGGFANQVLVGWWSGAAALVDARMQHVAHVKEKQETPCGVASARLALDGSLAVIGSRGKDAARISVYDLRLGFSQPLFVWSRQATPPPARGHSQQRMRLSVHGQWAASGFCASPGVGSVAVWDLISGEGVVGWETQPEDGPCHSVDIVGAPGEDGSCLRAVTAHGRRVLTGEKWENVEDALSVWEVRWGV